MKPETLLPPGQCLSVPGCWDGFSALLIEQAGFNAAFLTGGGLSMARFGRPDMGLVSMAQVAETIAVITDRISIPLFVDADTGFGNALNTVATVRAFERAGAAAIQLEDQTFPKRCGHMAGKGVIPLDEALGKIKAALDARDTALIIARTDALQVEGLQSALDRADAFLDAGADLIFIEGPPELAQMQAIGARYGDRVPLVHNLVEGAVTPVHTAAELAALGYRVALHPLLLLHGLGRLGPHLLARLKVDGGTTGIAGDILDLKAVSGLTGAPELVAQAARYA
jgi:2-methylisocitrate lyase-like PEP mutase family enzyme